MMNEHPLFEPLSRREREILALLGENLRDQEIVERLFLALPTVKWYNRQIFDKLGVKNRREAVKRAKALGLLAQNGAAEPAPAKHNLPSQLTPFVGRSRELAEIDGWLAHPHTRLLTILAPGGMGKTRLALEAAERSLSRYADGVFFAPLAALTSTDHVVPALAEALGLQFTPDGRTPEQQLTDFLRRKHLLLLIDNFEHLLDAAPLIADLLTAAPKVTALVTSRERLNLNGEVVYPLAGLHYPDAESEEPLRFGAAQLFVECALRANPHFVADDAGSIGQLCRRVQGMPLAIELAAALSGAISTSEIDTEVARSADFLSTSMVNVPERQRSVRAVFEAAWARLDEDARRAFRRMSVFRGGCTREAAQAVTGASVRTLAALVDKALLWRDPQSGRYEIHELLRQYAEAELEKAGDIEDIRRAHQKYYAALTTQWGSAMMFDRVEEGLTLFDADIDNVRSAFARASERAIPAEVEPFTDIWLYYDIRGRWREALIEFEAACDSLEPHDSVALARILAGRSLLCGTLQQWSQAYETGKRSVEMLRRLGAIHHLPFAIFAFTDATLILGDDPESMALRKEGFDIAVELNQRALTVVLGYKLGYEARNAGRREEAIALALTAHEKAVQQNNVWTICCSANALGNLYYGGGYLDQAAHFYTKCRDLAQTIRFRAKISAGLDGLANIARDRHNWEASLQYALEILKIRSETGLPDHLILELIVFIADISLRIGDKDEARQRLQQSLSYLSSEIGALFLKAWLQVAASYLIEIDEYKSAAILLSYFNIISLPDKPYLFPITYETVAACLKRCRAALSPEEFEAAWERGQTLTNEEAIALVAEAL